MAPSISVIIPAYNAASVIGQSIASVLQQSHPPIEIIVVDDGSVDRTAEVVSEIEGPIRLIRKANGGPASARNLGIRESRGEWVALLDADDLWYREKLETQLRYTVIEDVGLVHCPSDHRLDEAPEFITFDDMWRLNWIINSSVLIRRQALNDIGLFDEAPELISVEDYNLWLRFAASRWRIATCPQPLVHYTRGIGISSNAERLLKASLHNIETIGRQLHLPDQQVWDKKTALLSAFGGIALYERQLARARALLGEAFLRKRTPRNGARLLLALLPQRLLDLRRQAKRMLEPSEAAKQAAPRDPRAGIELAAAAYHCTRSDPPISGSRREPIDTGPLFQRPVLVTTIDAEESFDWGRPFSRSATDVRSMRAQHIAHAIFDRYGAKPVYMVDFPVAADDASREILRDLLQSGRCDIGAQLHPWVTPPFVETVSTFNSYAGNLSPQIEFQKIQSLTREIEASFGFAPRIFRAGRYGVGPHTAGMLLKLGYEADTSVVPCWSFSADGGPDFRAMSAHPFWIDEDRRLLELPISAAFVGGLAGLSPAIRSALFNNYVEKAGVVSALVRLGLLERIRLTPEGMSLDEAKRLVRAMRAAGHGVFVLSYHSPSLEPGNTPYVRTEADRDRFLAWLDGFYDFFVREIGGECGTWQDVRDRLRITAASTR
jgi:glycosyltransferase involved in cell wall biosynthesis